VRGSRALGREDLGISQSVWLRTDDELLEGELDHDPISKTDG
jgi:hypothetical protein